MGKPKGSEKTGGRKPGSPNVLSGTIRQKILDVFLDLQNIPQFSLREWVTRDDKNLGVFYTGIATKLVPTEISGPDGGAIKTESSLKVEDKEIIERYLKERQ